MKNIMYNKEIERARDENIIKKEYCEYDEEDDETENDEENAIFWDDEK